MDKQPRKILCISPHPESLLLYEGIIKTIWGANLDFLGVCDGREGFQIAIDHKPDLLMIEKWTLEIKDLLTQYEWWLTEGAQKKPWFEIRPYLTKLEERLCEVGRLEDFNFQYDWWLSVKIRKEMGAHILGVILFSERVQRGDIDPPYPDEFVRWLADPLNQVVTKPIEVNKFAKTVKTLIEAVEIKRENIKSAE